MAHRDTLLLLKAAQIAGSVAALADRLEITKAELDQIIKDDHGLPLPLFLAVIEVIAPVHPTNAATEGAP